MSGREPRERACRFGEGGRLVGVVTEPQGAPRAAAVLVTAGLTPKSGPFRLYARLARRLARSGVLALRFDLGGIGDSVQAAGSLPQQERTRLEIAAAVEHLRGRGAPPALFMGGLCSGAEDSLRYAAADSAVTGLFLIDPFGYKTPGWLWREAGIRALRRGLALAGLLPTCKPGSERGGSSLIDYQQMSREDSSRALSLLVERGVCLHFVYTGGMHETFNHRGQFRAMFRGLDFRGLATVDFFPQLRHTQVLEADNRLVIESIAARVEAAPAR